MTDAMRAARIDDLIDKIDWAGGKDWTDAYGKHSSPRDGYCELDDFILEFEYLPNFRKYVYWIAALVGFDEESTEIVDVILPPAFADTEHEAKRGALLALVDLLCGPRFAEAS